MSRIKVSVIGAGNIGGTIAYSLALKDIYDIALIDLNAGVAAGKALDIRQSGNVEHFGGKITGGSDYSLIAGSKAIIVTAGIARKPGMSRDDLIAINSKVIEEVAGHIKAHAPEAFVVVITNPLDAMVYHMWKKSGLDHKKVVGMAGVLDSSRFTLFLADELKVAPEDIKTFVLGGHGDTMVPLIGHTSIGGIPLEYFIEKGYTTKERIAAIVQRTRDGGAEIVQLLGTGSAFYSPATSGIAMIESYLFDQNRILPCAALLSGEYGVDNTYVGVPCIINKEGVAKIFEIKLSDEEKAMLGKSVEAVKGLVAVLK